eukprot:scaffold8634_cov115-Isochrysis_galbana.AAC.1
MKCRRDQPPRLVQYGAAEMARTDFGAGSELPRVGAAVRAQMFLRAETVFKLEFAFFLLKVKTRLVNKKGKGDRRVGVKGLGGPSRNTHESAKHEAPRCGSHLPACGGACEQRRAPTQGQCLTQMSLDWPLGCPPEAHRSRAGYLHQNLRYSVQPRKHLPSRTPIYSQLRLRKSQF